MGRGLREVAADVVCTLGMEEDEGKIDALAVSLAEAANKTFGSNSDLVVDFTMRVESRVRFDARRTCAGPCMRA